MKASEPYKSIDELLKIMGPKMQRLWLRELLAIMVPKETVTLTDAMRIHRELCQKRNDGEL